MRCPSCDVELSEGLRFCGRCGARLEQRCGGCGQSSPLEFRFCGGCGRPLAAADAPPARAFGPDGGERRNLTILFADLVGSTELAASLDPEDWRELVRGFQASASAVVARFAGHVAQHLGDGLLAYFGWPRAQGDDAERAVRAALALVHPEQPRDARLLLRVGLHTGPVVLTEVGTGSRVETLALGEAPNVAARVQALAEAGEVLITASTMRLVAGLFIAGERGRQPLKGVPHPVELFKIVRPVGLRRAAGRSATPFVGREQERRVLSERLAQARHGEGQIVLLVGEPGIGKSRLARTLLEDHAGAPFTWLEAGGSPHFANTPFYAVSELLKQALAAPEAESPDDRLARLARQLEESAIRPSEAIPLLAPLLDLPVPPQEPGAGKPPEAARKQLLRTLVEWVLAIAKAQPLVILLEDLQWVDPSTLELHQLLVEQAARAPILLLSTARPEFRAPWPLRSHHTQLALNRLTPEHTRSLVEQVAGGASLPPEVLEAVIARADGVPIFAEELTKAAIEAGARGEQEIPDTLADSLMARLDRLGPDAREVAQVASVVGREFSHVLLHAVHPIPEPELERALGKLVDAELAFVRGIAPEATYIFKHALVRDAAYDALLRSRRRELHGRLARALRERFPELCEAQPDLLAHHCTEAGTIDPAIDAWQRAGEKALGRGAQGEALRHFERGLALLATLPESPERDARELRIQLARWQALLFARGPAGPEAAAALDRAGALGERVNDPAQQVLLLWGLFSLVTSREGPAASRPLADQMSSAAERSGAKPLQVWAHFIQGVRFYFAGEVGRARELLGSALALHDDASAVSVPIDPRVAALPFAALAAWYVGRADEARARAREAIELAIAHKRPADRAWAESFAGVLCQLLREPAEALAHAEQVLAACVAEPNPVHQAMAEALRGGARSALGEIEAGLAELQQGVAHFLATGDRLGLESTLGSLSDAHARAGHLEEALRVLEEAEGIVPGEDLHRADTLRRRAELLDRTGAAASEVEAVYEEALGWARRQGCLAFELRAATSRARFLRERGRAAEASELLGPLVARFEEGFDTRDLRDAQRLLRELGEARREA